MTPPSERLADVIELPADHNSSEIIPIPRELRSIVSDVGTLERFSSLKLDGVKYALKNNGVILRLIIEPGDVDMSSMVGRTISISGSTIGRSRSDISVIQMKSASTFG